MFWIRAKTRYYKSIADIADEISEGSGKSFVSTFTGFYDFLKRATDEDSLGVDDEMTTKLFNEYIWPQARFYGIAYNDYEDLTAKETCYETCGRIWSWLKSSSQRYSVIIKEYENRSDKLMEDIKSTSNTTYSNTQTGSQEYTNQSSSVNDSTVSGTSENTSLFNDTPQTENWDDDNFTSNKTKTNNTNSNTSKDEITNTGSGDSSSNSQNNGNSEIITTDAKDTPIVRLDELKNLIFNAYQEWANEFVKYFCIIL